MQTPAQEEQYAKLEKAVDGIIAKSTPLRNKLRDQLDEQGKKDLDTLARYGIVLGEIVEKQRLLI